MDAITEGLNLIVKLFCYLVPMVSELEEYTIYSLISAATNLNINTISTISKFATIINNSAITLSIAFGINKLFFYIVDKITRRA